MAAPKPRFASLKSRDPKVRAKLQARLFIARKNRKKRQESS